MAVDEGVEDDEAVGCEVEAVATWLIEVESLSRRRPLRSKNESAAVATSAAVMLSTSFPSISRMRGGRDLSRCSRLRWSIVTSFVSSLSCSKNCVGVRSWRGLSAISLRAFSLIVGPYLNFK